MHHAQNDQYTHVMSILKKQHAYSAGLNSTCYAPIVQSLNNLSNEERERLLLKFDIAHPVKILHLPSAQRSVNLNFTMEFASVLRT